MDFKDLLLKIANNARLTSSELADLAAFGNDIQQRTSQVAGLFDRSGVLKVSRINPESRLLEVIGDITAAGGDVYVNARTNDQEDPHFVLQIDGVRKGELWFDRSANNVIISNNIADSDVVVTLPGTTPAGESLVVHNVALNASAHVLGLLGNHRFVSRSTDPDYVDGYANIYFYSSGGVDELRVRGKVGATETQVTLADITP